MRHMDHKNAKTIVITGPTASGKTSLSIALAKYLINEKKIPCVILNFDSLLFYKEISIATAKPTLEERENIPHGLIDIASIQDPLTAFDFIQMAKKEIEHWHHNGKLVLLVGGSAFYLRALFKGMYENQEPSNSTLSPQLNFEEVKNLQGIEVIIQYLEKNDPDIFNYIHQNDHYRLVRAAQYFHDNGMKLSIKRVEFDAQNPYDFSKNIVHFLHHHIHLDIPKEEHLRLIHKRTQDMLDKGIIDEILDLKNRGFDLGLRPLQSIGPKEVLDYLEGKIATPEECLEKINIKTRQYAKAQRTFFKKISPKLEYISVNGWPSQWDHILNDLLPFLEKK